MEEIHRADRDVIAAAVAWYTSDDNLVLDARLEEAVDNLITLRAITVESVIKHPFVVFPGDEGEGGYVITFPDLPGCMTQCEELEEIVPMAHDSYKSWAAVWKEMGNTLPESKFEDVVKKYGKEMKDG